MTAEYCLKKYVGKKFQVSSAGTSARFELANSMTISTLCSLGINMQNHIQRKVTQDMVKSSDIVITMAKDHQLFLKKEFGITSPLFNQVAYGLNSSIEDIKDRVGKDADEHVKNTVMYIYNSMPLLVQNMKHYIGFNGKIDI